MNDNFEINLLEKLTIPHVVFPQSNFTDKKKVSWHILSLTGQEILFASSFALSYEGIFTGISKNAIEYIAKNAPKKYKTELLNTVSKNFILQEVFKIAKSMDEDLGQNSTQNQQRVRNVIQYIKDNRIAFEF